MSLKRSFLFVQNFSRIGFIHSHAMKHACIFALTSVILFFTSFVSSAQVVINEYSASNLTSFADNFGQYEDWIELYNTTASPVNLTGWYLSNNKTKPTKWQLGNVTINANGFLRIWCSGRGINTGANLHANFKLTQCKTNPAIMLCNAAATVIDSLTMKRTQAGHSRGRTTNGAPTWSVFLTPTPNGSNVNAYQEYATAPIMSVGPGFYAGAQTITLSSPDPNITIRYTTNGSTPTATSTAYTTPISISSTKVLRAKAFSSTATVPASFVTSNTYFIGITHKVAVISIFGDQTATLLGGNQNLKPQTGIEYFDSTGTFKEESYGNTNKHGNDSWNYPQRGIDFVSEDEYGYNYAINDKLFNVKQRSSFQRIILKAAANDNYPFECPKAGNPYAWGDPTLYDGAHIRDSYVQTAAQKAGMYVDVRTWAPCVMYVNGNYWGVYDLREKVDDADFTSYYYNTKSDSLQLLQNWGGVWAGYGGNQAITDWNALVNYITSNNMAVQANYNYADSLLSMKSLVDYFIINLYAVTSDWLNWNTMWWRGTNVNASKRKWRYCLWDDDATFHHYINYTSIPNNNANASPCDPQQFNPNPPDASGTLDIWNALIKNQGFKNYFTLRYFDLVNTGLSCQRMTGILDSMINEIKPEMPGHITKWGGSMTAWQQNVSDLRNFILARCDSVIHQFNGCFNTTGPFQIKVNVDPPGSGTVDVNTLHLAQFVWSGTYPGNIPLNLTAHPNSPYCFDHWEFQKHTPSPSINDTAVTFSLNQPDSIIAHFTTSASAPNVTASDSSICPGDSSFLSVSGGSSFTWSPSTGLSCTTCANPVATPTSATTYTVVVNGTCAAGTSTITINTQQPGAPTVTASSPTVCVGGNVTLGVNGGTNFNWSPSTGLSCTTCANPTASPTTTTSYSVTATGGNCINGTSAVTVTVGPPVAPTVTAVNPAVCAGTTTTLNVNGGGSYTWSTGQTSSSISVTPSATTTYSVNVSPKNCVAGTGVVTVNVNQPPVPTVGSSPTICTTGEATLSAGGGTNYAWSPSAGLSCVNCPNPTATPNGTTTYYIIVSDANNCKAADSVIVFVSGECPEIFVPTGFSPNGDNNNDWLYVFGDMKEMHLVVYNRWGEKVFETSDKSIGWDGTSHGQPVQSGVYAYKFTATDARGNSISKSGNITVVR